MTTPFNAIDLNGMILGVSRLVNSNPRKTYLQVSAGSFMLRTVGYTNHDQYQRKLSKMQYVTLNEYFKWNEKFIAWEIRLRNIKGQKLVDIVYLLATVNGGNLIGVEMLKNVGEILIGAAGIWDQDNYQQHMGKSMYERIKSILFWDEKHNAWAIPTQGKSKANVEIVKYKSLQIR